MKTIGPPLPLAATDRFEQDLAWLDLLLEREILRLRARYELTLDELRGLYISDQQVDDLLRRGAPAADPLLELNAQAQALQGSRRGDTPLARLKGLLGLTSLEADLLLLALAPELALKYETLYAYLNNDITRRHPTVDLAVRVLGDAAAAEVREALCPGARLFSLGLLDWLETAEPRSALARGFLLSPPATAALQDLPLEDPRLPPGVQLLPPLAAAASDAENLSITALGASALAVLKDACSLRQDPGLVVISGENPAGQWTAGRLLAARQGLATLSIPLSVLTAEPSNWPTLRSRLRLLGLLADCALLIHDELGQFPQEPAPISQLVRQVRDLAGLGLVVCWCVPREAPWAVGLVDLPFQELNLPAPAATDRTQTWAAALESLGIAAEATMVEELAERFTLPGCRILAAAKSAVRGAAQDPADQREALWQAARRHSAQSLGQLATRLEKPHRFEHLVLPEATLRQVREIASAIAHRERVYGRWRMAERTGRGSGLMILFAGASGTGKTMTAAVIANDLRLDLYRIDLATVVSKYIGETEKNLDRIFAAAQHCNGILFFDEADALFGKRSEVKDAHDRYANIEIAYLLQKMEDHEGVVILATNLAKNLDQAFSRRMHYTIDFPRPDPLLRERLWRGMFPPAAPVSDDVDFHFLAEQFETSGGDIQMIALEAAFLASAGGQVIGMAEIVQAMARHQQKQGSPAAASGFRQYHALVRGR